MQSAEVKTMRTAKRRYAFYCRRDKGHVLENKADGTLELWRAAPKSPAGIRWRHTTLVYVARYNYYRPTP
jgi:hypothetical protein